MKERKKKSTVHPCNPPLSSNTCAASSRSSLLSPEGLAHCSRDRRKAGIERRAPRSAPRPAAQTQNGRDRHSRRPPPHRPRARLSGAPPPYLLRPLAVGRSRGPTRGGERDYESVGLNGEQAATARTCVQPWLRRRRLKTDIKAAGGEEGGGRRRRRAGGAAPPDAGRSPLHRLQQHLLSRRRAEAAVGRGGGEKRHPPPTHPLAGAAGALLQPRVHVLHAWAARGLRARVEGHGPGGEPELDVQKSEGCRSEERAGSQGKNGGSISGLEAGMCTAEGMGDSVRSADSTNQRWWCRSLSFHHGRKPYRGEIGMFLFNHPISFLSLSLSTGLVLFCLFASLFL